MKETELEIQKRLVDVFMELESEIATTFSEQVRLGWKQRNALISHVNSGFSKHNDLNAARNMWNAISLKYRVLNWLYEAMRKRRDLYGYFVNDKLLCEEIRSIWEYSIEREEFEIASILKKWVEKIPTIETVQTSKKTIDISNPIK